MSSMAEIHCLFTVKRFKPRIQGGGGGGGVQSLFGFEMLLRSEAFLGTVKSFLVSFFGVKDLSNHFEKLTNSVSQVSHFNVRTCFGYLLGRPLGFSPVCYQLKRTLIGSNTLASFALPCRKHTCVHLPPGSASSLLPSRFHITTRVVSFFS